jgi:hypothetical protein
MDVLYAFVNRVYQTFAGPNRENTWDVREALRSEAQQDLSTKDSKKACSPTRKSSSIRVVEEGQEEEEEEEPVKTREEERVQAEDEGYAASMRKEAFDLCMDRTSAAVKLQILDDMYAAEPSTAITVYEAHTIKRKIKQPNVQCTDLSVYTEPTLIHPDDWMLPSAADADFTAEFKQRSEHEAHVKTHAPQVARDVCVDALAPLSHQLLEDAEDTPKAALGQCAYCKSCIVGQAEYRLAHRVGAEVLKKEPDVLKAKIILLQYCDECIVHGFFII